MKRALLTVGLVLCPLTSAFGQMQCEGRLVEPGASEERVIELCGPPTKRVERKGEWPGGLWDSPASDGEEVDVEEWTYDLGPGRFERRLVFQNGVLQHVIEGGYGD